MEKGRGSHVDKLKGKVLKTCVTPACLGSTNNKNKEGGQKKGGHEEGGWDAMEPNMTIGEKQDEMGRPLGKNGCKQTNK